MVLRNGGVGGLELPTPWQTLAGVILKMEKRAASQLKSLQGRILKVVSFLSKVSHYFSQVCPFPNNHSANMKQKWQVHLKRLPTLAHSTTGEKEPPFATLFLALLASTIQPVLQLMTDRIKDSCPSQPPFSDRRHSEWLGWRYPHHSWERCAPHSLQHNSSNCRTALSWIKFAEHGSDYWIC